MNYRRYRIAICDDERAEAERLGSVVSDWSRAAGIDCAIDTFSGAEALLSAREDRGEYDILLLDVEMRGMDGIALARRLRADGCRAEIIFVTSHFELAGEGYDVDALHYLIKPVANEKLAEVLSRAAGRLAVEPPSVVIFCDGGTVRLYESDILYVESFLHDIVIHTAAGEYRTKESISAFGDRLSGDFFRTHRSYIVNLRAVVRIGRTSVTLEGGAVIPLARGKYDEANRAFIARM